MGSFVSLGAYTWLSSLLLTVVNAALVGVVGWLLIKFLLGFIAKFLKKTKIDPLLHTVILSVTKIALLVLLAISVLDKLGHSHHFHHHFAGCCGSWQSPWQSRIPLPPWQAAL